VGLFVIAIGSLLTSFGVSWSSVESEYALSPTKKWILVGGLTATSAVFKIRLPEVADETASNFHLVLSNDENLQSNRLELDLTTKSENGVTAGFVSLERQQGIRTLVVDNLEPETQYHYIVEKRLVSGAVIALGSLRGRIRTPAKEGTQFNFTIATAGCAWTGSRAELFPEIAKEDPLMFVHLGDMHYEDINENSMNKRIDAISTVLASDTQSEFYRSTAFVNMWDDHDWLGGNSDGVEEQPGARNTALLSYQLAFPHYPLAALIAAENPATASPNNDNINNNNATAASAVPGSSTTNTNNPIPVPVYHAFTIGTVRFVISDLRSESNDTYIQSIEQTNWLKQEFSKAAEYDFVIWVTTRTWIGTTTGSGDDSWAGYSSERRQLSEFISNTIGQGSEAQNLLAISADPHMVGFDNGFNTYYGPSGLSSGRSFPILQSGAMDRFGSTKGDTYSHGCWALGWERTHQFSTIKFEFTHEKCIVIDSYRRVDFASENRTKIFSKRLCGKIFEAAAQTEEEKAGSCEIEKNWSGNKVRCIAAAIIGFFTMVLASFAIFKSDASTIGDCCCKTFVVVLIVSFSYLLTLLVSFGVYFVRGVEQMSWSFVVIIVLVERISNFFYLVIWWACCKSSNLRRLDDDDPAFRDVKSNPTFQHVGLDIQQSAHGELAEDTNDGDGNVQNASVSRRKDEVSVGGNSSIASSQ